MGNVTNNTANTFVQQSTTVQAVQWTGEIESLRAIQQLIAPFSPYRTSHAWPELSPALGIPVKPEGIATATELRFAGLGDWVVRTADGRFAIWGERRFASEFVAAVAEPLEQFASPAGGPSLRDF